VYKLSSSSFNPVIRAMADIYGPSVMMRKYPQIDTNKLVLIHQKLENYKKYKLHTYKKVIDIRGEG
jgi:hypothetical protein